MKKNVFRQNLPQIADSKGPGRGRRGGAARPTTNPEGNSYNLTFAGALLKRYFFVGSVQGNGPLQTFGREIRGMQREGQV